MKRAILFASAAMIGVGLLSGTAGAQGVPQVVELAKVDVQTLAAGYRASKVIGSSVVNDTDETIGRIDDILISSDGKQPYAVLSIGGFLGMDSHLIVVPYNSLKFERGKSDAPRRDQGRTQDAPGVQIRCEVIAETAVRWCRRPNAGLGRWRLSRM